MAKRAEHFMQASLVIPIKQLSDAKQRLSSILDAEQRQALFRAMVEDVLEVATTCDQIADIVVVTSDDTVTELAFAYGARVLAEPAQPGLINAVTLAALTLAEEGVEVMIFLPGDTPLVTVEELEVVLGGVARPDTTHTADTSGTTGRNASQFLIVPATDLGGSNCVVCAPPNCMEFGFGEDSFRRHLGLARTQGIEPSVVKLPGIGLDVDTPEDLSQLINILIEQDLQSHTYHFLLQHGLLMHSKSLEEDIDLPLTNESKI